MTKTVILNGGIIVSIIGPTGPEQRRLANKVMEEAFEIKVRNHKDQPVEVIVRENLYRWSQWTMIDQSSPSVKKDARTVEFPVKVSADGEATVTYRVRYTW